MMSLLCLYMEKLTNHEVDNSEAYTMSKLVGQASNLLNYEIKRAIAMSNTEIASNFRNIEEKAFDSIPETTIQVNDKLQTEINRLALELKELRETIKQ